VPTEAAHADDLIQVILQATCSASLASEQKGSKSR